MLAGGVNPGGIRSGHRSVYHLLPVSVVLNQETKCSKTGDECEFTLLVQVKVVFSARGLTCKLPVKFYTAVFSKTRQAKGGSG